MRFLKYIAVFLLGFLMSKFWYEHREEKKHQEEEIRVFLNGIQNLSKLVLLQGNFSEIYSFSDSKKYFYDYVSFDKKAIVSVNAKVEVGYDLSKLEISLDSVQKTIIIHKIPKEEITIIPDVKYFDLQQSQFNTFTQKELNALNKKAIENIESSIIVSGLQKEAKYRLFQELSKFYQLSKTYNWQVVDKTDNDLFKSFSLED